MRYSKTVKVISVIGLAITLFSLTIAYAVLGANLSITGKGSVTNPGWNIHFENVTSVPTGTAVCGNPDLADTSLSNFLVTLKSASDTCTYTFDVVNGGGIDAVLKTISSPSTSNGMVCEGLSSVTGSSDGTKMCNNLSIQLTYTGSTTGTVKVNDTLDHSTTKKMSLKFSLKSTSSNIPSDDVRVKNIKFSIIYNQTT